MDASGTETSYLTKISYQSHSSGGRFPSFHKTSSTQRFSVYLLCLLLCHKMFSCFLFRDHGVSSSIFLGYREWNACLDPQEGLLAASFQQHLLLTLSQAITKANHVTIAVVSIYATRPWDPFIKVEVPLLPSFMPCSTSSFLEHTCLASWARSEFVLLSEEYWHVLRKCFP